MSQVLVWKCDHTGELFEDKKKYMAHLRKEARKNLASKFEKKRRLEALDKIENMNSLDCIEKSLPEVVQKYYKAAGKDPKHISFSFERMIYKKCVSNSHSCPRGGLTNWGGTRDNEGAPRGYPGLEGRINIELDPKYKIDSICGYGYFKGLTDFLKSIGINTGTGGGGYGHLSYHVVFFASDFPEMEEMYTHISEQLKYERNKLIEDIIT